jgi:ketosteroid isomerase-like protein
VTDRAEEIRRVVDAYNRDGIESGLWAFDPGIHWASPPDWMDQAGYDGHEGLRKLDSQWRETFDGYGLELNEIRRIGDFYVVLLHQYGRIRATGDDITQVVGWVMTYGDNGLIVHVAAYFSWDDTLEAAVQRSDANVRRFVEGIEAFNRRDIPGSRAVMDPELVWEHRLAELEGTFAGPAAVLGWYADLWENFETIEIVCPDIRDLGGGRMLGLGTVRGTGRESGAETTFTYAVVATYRNERMVHYVDYGDHGEALEAAGLNGA